MSDIARILRPRRFKDMVGVEKLVQNIRKHFEKKNPPAAWLFSGPTGVGKTTIARIMAISFQCRHSEFGSPCKKCMKNKRTFDIVEINASDTTGIDTLRDVVQGAYFVPKPGSRRRVYILDEAHQLSKSAQNLLLKYTEDCPRTTNWIICTTEPGNILETLRGRCLAYQVPLLGLEDVTKLVRRGLKFLKSERDVADLVDQLMNQRILGARNVLRSVQKYADTDCTPKEAAEFGIISEVNTHDLCRAIYTGSWEDAAKLLLDISNDEVPKIRGSIAGYYKEILLGQQQLTSRNAKIADHIMALNSIYPTVPALVALLYKQCRFFAKG